MTRRRSVVQTVGLLSTVLLAACGAAEDDLSETQEITEKAVPLPYTATFHFKDPVMSTQVFDLPKGASITVTADGGWDRPGACPRTPYTITPFGKDWIGHYTNGLGPRTYPSNGSTHRETWRNLDAGRYRLDIEAGLHAPNCLLIGTITITSP